MEKICGNCKYYKDIPQMRGAGCTMYEPIPLMAEDGPFLGYPPINKEQKACEDWVPESGRYKRHVFVSAPKANLPDSKLPPEWLRTTFIDEKGPDRDFDRVFVPIEAFCGHAEQFLCACYDGVPIICDKGHVYAPASWIIRKQPDTRDCVMLIVNRVINETCKSSA